MTNERAPKSSRLAARSLVARAKKKRADDKKSGGKPTSSSHKSDKSDAAITKNQVGNPAFTSGGRPLSVLLKAVWSFARLERRALVLGFVFATLSSILNLVPPALTKVAIDFGISDVPGPSGLIPYLGERVATWSRIDVLLAVGVALVSFAVVIAVVSVSAKALLMQLGNRVNARVRRRAFGHVTELPLEKLTALKSGQVASLLRGDAGSVGILINTLFISPWSSIVQLTGTLIVLTILDPIFLGGVIVLGVVVFFTHRTWIAGIRPLWRLSREQRSIVDGHAAEVVGGMRVVRTFGQQLAATRQFLVGNDVAARLQIRAWWWGRGVESIWEVFTPLAGALVLVYGGMRVIDGALTLGDVMMFTTYMLALLGPIQAMVSLSAEIQDGLAGLDRLLDLMESPIEHASSRDGQRVNKRDVKGEVRLEEVRFRYPGTEKFVLDGVSLVAAAGQTVALVGSSGAGKTTITHLLARFYDPDEGRITLDGVDIRSLHLRDVRNLISIVEQDVFLFDGTITENIRFARHGASDAEIEAAATKAHAHTFIDALPNRYDTVIGERGVKLSGGQRQRIALARALLADPRILILDEATASLDAESEHHIKMTLETLRQGRTSFIIAHRLSTIRDADLVVVIEDGRVNEQGTHSALMKKRGRYADLVSRQVGEVVRDD